MRLQQVAAVEVSRQVKFRLGRRLDLTALVRYSMACWCGTVWFYKHHDMGQGEAL